MSGYILQPPSARQRTVNRLDKFELEREVKEGKRVLLPVRLVGFERLRDWEYFDGDTG